MTLAEIKNRRDDVAKIDAMIAAEMKFDIGDGWFLLPKRIASKRCIRLMHQGSEYSAFCRVHHSGFGGGENELNISCAHILCEVLDGGPSVSDWHEFRPNIWTGDAWEVRDTPLTRDEYIMAHLFTLEFPAQPQVL